MWHRPAFAAIWAVSLAVLAAAAIWRGRRGAPCHPITSAAAARLALALALAVVGLDMALYPRLFGSPLWLADGVRALLAAQYVLVLGAVSGWRWSELGLRLRPRQGWWWWIRAALLFGAIGLVAAIAFVALVPPQLPPGWRETQLHDLPRHLYLIGVSAPVFEESIHRLAFCTAAAAASGRWPTIAASGLLFGALHLAYGNPDPSNMLGGFVLAWAYLKSGSILIPIGLHSLGNLSLFAFNLALASL